MGLRAGGPWAQERSARAGGPTATSGRAPGAPHQGYGAVAPPRDSRILWGRSLTASEPLGPRGAGPQVEEGSGGPRSHFSVPLTHSHSSPALILGDIHLHLLTLPGAHEGSPLSHPAPMAAGREDGTVGTGKHHGPAVRGLNGAVHSAISSSPETTAQGLVRKAHHQAQGEGKETKKCSQAGQGERPARGGTQAQGSWTSRETGHHSQRTPGSSGNGGGWGALNYGGRGEGHGRVLTPAPLPTLPAWGRHPRNQG